MNRSKTEEKVSILMIIEGKLIFKYDEDQDPYPWKMVMENGIFEFDLCGDEEIDDALSDCEIDFTEFIPKEIVF